MTRYYLFYLALLSALFVAPRETSAASSTLLVRGRVSTSLQPERLLPSTTEFIAPTRVLLDEGPTASPTTTAAAAASPTPSPQSPSLSPSLRGYQSSTNPAKVTSRHSFGPAMLAAVIVAAFAIAFGVQLLIDIRLARKECNEREGDDDATTTSTVVSEN
jgi:hypothetical protein